MEGKYEARPINLNKLVSRTAETFGSTKKEIRVHFDPAPALLPVRADVSQIEQVLFTLYVNASDAMPHGGDLFLETMNVNQGHMEGKPYRPKPGNYVLLSVRDTGRGMDKETMEPDL